MVATASEPTECHEATRTSPPLHLQPPPHPGTTPPPPTPTTRWLTPHPPTRTPPHTPTPPTTHTPPTSRPTPPPSCSTPPPSTSTTRWPSMPRSWLIASQVGGSTPTRPRVAWGSGGGGGWLKIPRSWQSCGSGAPSLGRRRWSGLGLWEWTSTPAAAAAHPSWQGDAGVAAWLWCLTLCPLPHPPTPFPGASSRPRSSRPRSSLPLALSPTPPPHPPPPHALTSRRRPERGVHRQQRQRGQ